jgi:hypothetical protein
MTQSILIAFAKCVIFGLSQIFLIAMMTENEKGNDGQSFLAFIMYGVILFGFFYWVYPV